MSKEKQSVSNTPQQIGIRTTFPYVVRLKIYECCLAGTDFFWTSNLEAYSFIECWKLLDAIRISMFTIDTTKPTDLRITKIVEL